MRLIILLRDMVGLLLGVLILPLCLLSYFLGHIWFMLSVSFEIGSGLLGEWKEDQDKKESKEPYA